MPSRRWRSAAFKGAAAVALATLAVLYQDTTPQTAARGAGMVLSQGADLGKAMQLVGHVGAVIGVATSEQGRWIVSAGSDATLRVWNAGSGALARTIELDDGAATALAVGERRALVGHKGGAVVLWDLERAEKLATFQLGTSTIASLAFTTDPNTFAVAAQDGTVALLDVRAPSSPSVLLDGVEAGGVIVAAAHSRDLIASAGAGRSVRIWRTESRSLMRTYRGQAGEVAAMDFSPDGRYLAAAGSDGTIRVWSSTSRGPRILRAGDRRVVAIALGPERAIITGSDDGKVRLWNVGTGRLVRTFAAGSGAVRSVHFSPDGRRAIAGGQDGIIRVWSLDSSFASGI